MNPQVTVDTLHTQAIAVMPLTLPRRSTNNEMGKVLTPTISTTAGTANYPIIPYSETGVGFGLRSMTIVCCLGRMMQDSQAQLVQEFLIGAIIGVCGVTARS